MNLARDVLPYLQRSSIAIVLAGLAACGGGGDAPAVPPTISAQEACVALTGKSIAGATISAATVMTASPPLPEYCKVVAQISPDLNFEMRMPTTTWNSKLHYQGGGDTTAPSHRLT